MADEIVFDEKKFISSKRASQLTGYAQDYVGQLARGGAITARRVGGLWYIEVESLTAHKNRADEYKPVPPAPVPISAGNTENIITLEGKSFISASRAAKITGYHQDYIGQLARAGKIASQQVGNRWYIDQVSIEKHKEEKDALLGAVQSEAVGIKPPVSQLNTEPKEPIEYRPYFNYQPENIESQQAESVVIEIRKQQNSPITNIKPYDGRSIQSAVPIRVGGTELPNAIKLKQEGQLPARKRNYTVILVVTGIAIAAAASVLLFGNVLLSNLDRLRGSAAHETSLIYKVTSYVEGLFAKDIEYTGKK